MTGRGAHCSICFGDGRRVVAMLFSDTLILMGRATAVKDLLFDSQACTHVFNAIIVLNVDPAVQKRSVGRGV